MHWWSRLLSTVHCASGVVLSPTVHCALCKWRCIESQGAEATMQIGIIRGEANTDILAAPDLDIHKWIGVVKNIMDFHLFIAWIFCAPSFKTEGLQPTATPFHNLITNSPPAPWWRETFLRKYKQPQCIFKIYTPCLQTCKRYVQN